MSSWAPTKYKTTKWSAYNDALKRRGSLELWFDPEMVWEPPPGGKRGRQQRFSDAAIQACLTLKVLFGMPLRQTTGFVQSLLRLVGLDWAVPDYSTLCRRQKTLNVSLPYRAGTGPLNLLIDSTGIKSEGEGEWNARKHPSHTCKHVLPGNGWPQAAYLAQDTHTLPGRASLCDVPRGGSTQKRWKSGPWKSPPVMLATRQCCPSCSTKSRPIRKLGL